MCQCEQFMVVHTVCSRAHTVCLCSAATQDPAAGTDSGGASGQWIICSAQPGRWLGHHYTSEKHNRNL